MPDAPFGVHALPFDVGLPIDLVGVLFVAAPAIDPGRIPPTGVVEPAQGRSVARTIQAVTVRPSSNLGIGTDHRA